MREDGRNDKYLISLDPTTTKGSPHNVRNLIVSHIPPGGGFTKGLGPKISQRQKILSI